MSVTGKFGQNLLAGPRRLVGEAEEQQRPYFEAKHREAGIDSEPVAEQLLPDGIAVSLGLLQTFQRRPVLPHKGVHRAAQAVADGSVGGVILPFGDFDNLACKVERRLPNSAAMKLAAQRP